MMTYFAVIAQLIVAVSIVIVWVFRFDNILKEFKQYGLSDLIRTMVGSAKIALATLLVAGIWYPSLVLIPAFIMAFLMLSAQYFHFKVKNPWQKRMPSLLLLLLCLFIAAVSLNIIS
ncbi:MAG: DoxX family protein [Bacteroidales bacterium]|nr:DoxX family protein [Bacteroidales bacterium]